MLRPDERAMGEIEDAPRIAEQSGDDVAVAISRMTLGIALVHRPTNAERDRGQQVLAEVREVFMRRGFFLAELPSSTFAWVVKKLTRRSRWRYTAPARDRRRPVPRGTPAGVEHSCDRYFGRHSR